MHTTATAELLISADSHVVECGDLWAQRLPASLRDRAPSYANIKRESQHAGARDPAPRLGEMEVDGVSCEVLYPTLALEQFGLADAELQVACFSAYNDWIMEYCSYSPARLLGIACISTYDIDAAVRELERCKNQGLCGALVWQVPPAELSFAGTHYEKFWAAAQDLDMPVSLHILTGAPYPPGLILNQQPGDIDAIDRVRRSVNEKLSYVADALLNIVGSGVLDRFPKAKLVLVENEISWLPFVLSQWDKYIARGGKHVLAAKELPSAYLGRQVFATFFNDPPSRWLLGKWGTDSCMWSSDFPHPNSTWPHSRDVIARDLGHLPATTRAKLLSENVADLYGINVEELQLAAS